MIISNPISPLVISRGEWLKSAIEACKESLKDDPDNKYWKFKLEKYRREYYELTPER